MNSIARLMSGLPRSIVPSNGAVAMSRVFALLLVLFCTSVIANEPSSVVQELSTPAPGRYPVTFVIDVPSASDVRLEFTGNYWNRKPEDTLRLKASGTSPSHELTLYLGEGQWLYRFRVDGRWRHDPSNPDTVGAENGERNSVLFVGKRNRPRSTPAGTLTELAYESDELGRTVPLVIYRPDVPPGPLPVLLLLHGFGQPATDWAEAIGAHLALDRLLDAGEVEPFLLAMPSGENGFWLGGHARHVLDEVLPALARDHDALIGRGTTGIGGFSAGGHGALRLGYLAQDRIGLVMPIAMAAQCAGNICDAEGFARLYPPPIDLDVAMWVGVNDELELDLNHDALSEWLDELDMPHEDIRTRAAGHREDGHSVRYVRTIVNDILRRASSHFGDQ